MSLMRAAFWAGTTVLLALPSTAEACSCPESTPPGDFAAAKAVFLGRVVSLEELLNEREEYKAVIRFEVTTSWKQVSTREVILETTAEHTCDYFFDVGTEYVVFAFPVEDKGAKAPFGTQVRWTTNSCTGTRKTSSPYAAKTLEWLKQRKPLKLQPR